MSHKCLQRLQLIIAEKGIVLHRLELRHIGEELFGVDKVFVHVVEVGQDHLSPEDEFVQRLTVGNQLLVLAVEV